MAELKPCPFCGRIDTIGVYTWQEINGTDYEDTSEYDKTHYAACCNLTKGGCGAVKGGDYEAPDAAADGWNRRAENGRSD